MGGIVFGMGNIISIVMCSLLLYICVEYPLKEIVKIVLRRKEAKE
jgi:hypothetical protein